MRIEDKVKKEGFEYGEDDKFKCHLISQDKCIKLIKEACKKQRKICEDIWQTTDDDELNGKCFLNACEPTWEE